MGKITVIQKLDLLHVKFEIIVTEKYVLQLKYASGYLNNIELMTNEGLKFFIWDMCSWFSIRLHTSLRL